MSKGVPSETFSFKGLSPADLVVLFAYHGGKEGRVCFYRDQIWLNWREEDIPPAQSARGVPGLQRIADRWIKLPERLRNWIVPGHAGRPTTSLVHNALVDARKERDSNWVLRPDRTEGRLLIPLAKEQEVLELLGRPSQLSIRQIAKRAEVSQTAVSAVKKAGEERTRRFGCWFRNRLWLNWHEAFGQSTWRNLERITDEWSTLPRAVQSALTAEGEKFASRSNQHDPVHPSNKVVHNAITHARRLRDGHDGGIPQPGSLRKRRRLWLEWTQAGVRRSDVPEKWNAMAEAERLTHGGPRHCHKLHVRRGKKGRTTQYVNEEVRLAAWEREIEGKRTLFGQGLWFLKQERSGIKREEIADAWDRMSYVNRKHKCPGNPEPLPANRRARLGRVANGIRLAKELDGEAFLDTIKPKGYGFGERRPYCQARNDLFLELRETRWKEAGERYEGIARLCKAMPEDELRRRGVNPRLIEELPAGRLARRIVNGGLVEAAQRRTGGNGKSPKTAKGDVEKPRDEGIGATNKPRKKPRGSYRTAYNHEVDSDLYDQWLRARSKNEGLEKAQFAASREMDLEEVKATLERERKRRKREKSSG